MVRARFENKSGTMYNSLVPTVGGLDFQCLLGPVQQDLPVAAKSKVCKQEIDTSTPKVRQIQSQLGHNHLLIRKPLISPPLQCPSSLTSSLFPLVTALLRFGSLTPPHLLLARLGESFSAHR